MSNSQHTDAALIGFDGPYFTSALAALQALLDEGRDTHWFVRAAETVAGFTHAPWKPTTSDRYSWYAAATFMRAGGSVNLLFPFANAGKERDGTRRDRSMAVYGSGVDAATIEVVLNQLVDAVRRQQWIDRYGQPLNETIAIRIAGQKFETLFRVVLPCPGQLPASDGTFRQESMLNGRPVRQLMCRQGTTLVKISRFSPGTNVSFEVQLYELPAPDPLVRMAVDCEGVVSSSPTPEMSTLITLERILLSL